jgi:DNA segregation ATPase FtsK/SpoIIIE-like protein
VIDEFSDRLDQDEELSADVQELIQKARNFNINLVMLAQKMTVSVPTVISNNIGCRIVGRIADKADAKRTGGESCLAHRLAAGRGAFELHNGIHSVRIQGLYIDPADIPQTVGDVCQRWAGQQAQGLALIRDGVAVGTSKKSDPAFLTACAGAQSASAIRKIYSDMFGKQLAHYDAVAILGGL